MTKLVAFSCCLIHVIDNGNTGDQDQLSPASRRLYFYETWNLLINNTINYS
jgi:hypothetical protein